MCKLCNKIKAKKTFKPKEIKDFLKEISKKPNMSHFDDIIDHLLSIDATEVDGELDQAWEDSRD